jgi:hypothetical protein
MFTVRDFAKAKKVSLRVARTRLENLEAKGLMRRLRGPNNLYLYYETKPVPVKWHDPFNRIERGLV